MKRIKASNLNRGLVGAWCPSVAGNGLLLPDLSGYGNHGTLTNMDASDWVGTDRGRALDFDGVNDRVFLDSQNEIAAPLSLTVWCVVRSSINSGIFGIANKASATGWHGVGYNNAWQAYTNDGLANAPFLIISGLTNSLGFLTYTIEPSRRVFWLNASSSIESTTSFNASIKHNKIDIGCFRNSSNNTVTSFSNCQVLEARIYDRALSPSEIKQLYEGGPGYGLRQERKRSRFASATNRRRRLICGASV